MENRFPDSFLPHISRLILSPASAFCSLSWWGSATVTRIHHVPGDFNKEVTLCKVISAEIFSFIPPQKHHQQGFSSSIKPYSCQTQPRFVFSTVLERYKGRINMYPQRSQGMCLVKATSRGLTPEWKGSTKKFRNLCSITEDRARTDLITSGSLSLFPHPQQKVASWMCHF